MNSFSVENLAFDFALEFRKHYKKYTHKVYRIDNIKKTKWWVHFIKAAEKYIDYPDFDLVFFIAVQFEKHGKILPFFLAGKTAEETYKQNYFKENSEENKILSEVNGSFEAIKNWALKNKKNVNEYFDPAKKWVLQSRVEYLSPYFLAFSKSFLSTYSKLNEEERKLLFSKDDLSIKRAYVKQFPDTKRKIKELLKEDFI